MIDLKVYHRYISERFSRGFREVLARFSRGFREVPARFPRGSREVRTGRANNLLWGCPNLLVQCHDKLAAEEASNPLFFSTCGVFLVCAPLDAHPAASPATHPAHPSAHPAAHPDTHFSMYFGCFWCTFRLPILTRTWTHYWTHYPPHPFAMVSRGY